MSLFPAYQANETADKAENAAASGNTWLSNSSFTTAVPVLRQASSDSSSSSDDDVALPAKQMKQEEIKPESSRKRKHKKEKKRRKEKAIKCEMLENERKDFYQDKTRELAYLNMTQPPKGSRPRFQRCQQRFPSVMVAKQILQTRKKAIRYFSRKAVKPTEHTETNDDELKVVVETLNKAVHEDPREVENWLKLVHFQEDYFSFQQIKFKTVSEKDRAISNQKLEILARAMTANPGNEKLQDLWLQLAVDCCPADEVESKIVDLMKIQGSTLPLHLNKIMLTQTSMPRCKSSTVLKLYRDAMESLQRAKNLAGTEQDKYCLELFLHSCVFLEQCGLWEMAWKAVQLNLSLNLSLDVPAVCSSEDIIIQKENELFTVYNSSGTPVWNIWTSLEALRQGHHFLPVASSSDFPQRVVAKEDVVGLVHHVRRNSQFRLLILLPLLSSVPLLPTTHCLLSAVVSQHTPWLLDSVEWHLSSVLCQSPLLKLSGKFLSNHLPNSLPPQYLQQLPGQEEFLALSEKNFELMLSATSGRQRVASAVWYLRFLRWLDRLAKLGRYHPPQSRPKTKNLFKQFLKREDNRDILLLYVEYGLWEYESGSASSSVNTLQTLVQSRGSALEQSDHLMKTDLCALHRTLCEVQICSGDHEGAKLSLGRLCGTSNYLLTLSKLKHTAFESLHFHAADDLEDLMLPNYTVDWNYCYAMGLALAGRVDEVFSYLDDVMRTVKGSHVRERIWEVKLGICRSFASDRTQFIIAAGIEMLKEYPYNLAAITIVNEVLISATGLWWKQLSQIISSPSNMGAISAICALMERQRVLNVPDNRSRGLLKRLAAKGGKTSILVHRMRLADLSASRDVEGLEAARILALEAFPWCKDLYLDSISTSPNLLMDLTDMLVEKDLRIHITPDEIEAMRD